MYIRVGAGSWSGPRSRPCEVTFGSSTARVDHLETSPIESKARHNLVGRNTSLCNHSQRISSFCRVHLAAEAATSGTSWAWERLDVAKVDAYKRQGKLTLPIYWHSPTAHADRRSCTQCSPSTRDMSALLAVEKQSVEASHTTTSDMSLIGKPLRYQYEAGAAIDRVLPAGSWRRTSLRNSR